jgi:hypothetical protein
MADPKLEAHHLALAAAQGVAIALSHRPQQGTQEFHLPPRIICGIPPYIFEAAFKHGPDNTVTVGAITEAKAT